MATELWRRPASVPFPVVWSEFDGRKALADGSTPHFTVEDATEEWHDAVVEHMSRNYLGSGSVGSAIGVRDDPESLAEVQRLWRAMLRQRAALIALVHGEAGARRLAGVNVTWVRKKAADALPKPQYKGYKMKQWTASIEYLRSLTPDLYQRYDVTEYLTALGLSVEPEFRGQGVGEALLRARWPLCRALGVRLTVTTFTSKPAQVLAKRVGFETVVELFYKDHPDPQVQAIAATPSMILTAARID